MKKERVINGVCLDSFMRILDKDLVNYLYNHSAIKNYYLLCSILDLVRSENKR